MRSTSSKPGSPLRPSQEPPPGVCHNRNRKENFRNGRPGSQALRQDGLRGGDLACKQMTPPLPKDGWYLLWQVAEYRSPISFHSTAAISLSMRREITSENAGRLYHLA
jgi:hypothetical protein